MAMPPTWLRASVVSILSSKPCYNVLWYAVNLTPNPAEGQAVATACATEIDALVAGPLKAWLASDAAFGGVETSLSINDAVFTATSVAGAGPGTGGVDALPAYSAAIVQKRTALGGRTGRGRWYVPGCPEGFTSASRLTAGGQTALGNVATAFSTPFVGVTTEFFPCLHHGPGEGDLASLIGVRPLVTLGTMRRRMVRPQF